MLHWNFNKVHFDLVHYSFICKEKKRLGFKIELLFTHDLTNTKK